MICDVCGSAMTVRPCGRQYCKQCFNKKRNDWRTSPEGRLYSIFTGILQRCRNKAHRQYYRYGGRGIQCLFGSPEEFIAFALANGWRRGLLTDRIDNNGPYAPWNCRFVDSRISNRNMRSTRLTESLVKELRTRHASGERLGVLAKSLGITPSGLHSAIHGKTWSEIK